MLSHIKPGFEGKPGSSEPIKKLAEIIVERERVLQQNLENALSGPWFSRPSKAEIVELSTKMAVELREHVAIVMNMNLKLLAACEALKEDNNRLNDHITDLLLKKVDCEGNT